MESKKLKDNSNLVDPIEKELVQKIGQRFLSEANDIKRTFESICDELNLEISRFIYFFYNLFLFCRIKIC